LANCAERLERGDFSAALSWNGRAQFGQCAFTGCYKDTTHVSRFIRAIRVNRGLTSEPTSDHMFSSFVEILRSSHGYSLSDVQLDRPNATTAIFKARLNAPAGSAVWARAWLSNETETLAESASPQLKAGDNVKLEVILKSTESPQYAYMRIESAPLKTEHIVSLKLA
jgi:hypothetical protein